MIWLNRPRVKACNGNSKSCHACGYVHCHKQESGYAACAEDYCPDFDRRNNRWKKHVTATMEESQ